MVVPSERSESRDLRGRRPHRSTPFPHFRLTEPRTFRIPAFPHFPGILPPVATSA